MAPGCPVAPPRGASPLLSARSRHRGSLKSANHSTGEILRGGQRCLSGGSHQCTAMYILSEKVEIYGHSAATPRPGRHPCPAAAQAVPCGLLSHCCPAWGQLLANCSSPHRPPGGAGAGGGRSRRPGAISGRAALHLSWAPSVFASAVRPCLAPSFAPRSLDMAEAGHPGPAGEDGAAADEFRDIIRSRSGRSHCRLHSARRASGAGPARAGLARDGGFSPTGGSAEGAG